MIKYVYSSVLLLCLGIFLWTIPNAKHTYNIEEISAFWTKKCIESGVDVSRGSDYDFMRTCWKPETCVLKILCEDGTIETSIVLKLLGSDSNFGHIYHYLLNIPGWLENDVTDCAVLYDYLTNRSFIGIDWNLLNCIPE